MAESGSGEGPIRPPQEVKHPGGPINVGYNVDDPKVRASEVNPYRRPMSGGGPQAGEGPPLPGTHAPKASYGTSMKEMLGRVPSGTPLVQESGNSTEQEQEEEEEK